MDCNHSPVWLAGCSSSNYLQCKVESKCCEIGVGSVLREEGNSEERKGFPEDVNFMVCPDLPQCVCTLHFRDSWAHFFYLNLILGLFSSLLILFPSLLIYIYLISLPIGSH